MKTYHVSAFRMYRSFFSMHLRTAMEYKSSFLMTIFGMTLTSFASFLAIWILFDRFHTVDGYTLSEVLLCHSTIMIGFSISEILLRGFDVFSSQVQSGSFDRLLLRPRTLFLSVLVSRMEFARVGRLVQSIVILIYAVWKTNLTFTAAHTAAFVLMILGSAVFFSALMILGAGVCFFTIEGIEVMNIFTHGGKELGSYPLDIYNSRALILFFTFFVPLACAQYYPFLYLTGRESSFFYALTPCYTIVFFLFSLIFFYFGVRHYQSTGS